MASDLMTFDDEAAKNELELNRYWHNVLKECKAIKEERSASSKPQGLTTPSIATNNYLPNSSTRMCAPIERDKLSLARIYNELIHSGKYTEKLIELEFSYAPDVEDMLKTRDISLNELQTKSAKEIEAAIGQLGKLHTEATISSMSSRHCQDMERLLNNWTMSIEALKDAQREDFMDKLKTLYIESQSPSNDLEAGGQTEISSNNIESTPKSERLDRKYAPKQPKVTKSKKSESTKARQLSSDCDNASSNFEDLSYEITTYPISMEESFTINLGSQLKTAHNLRIMAVDSLYLCDTHRNRSSQMRLETAMSLYSHNLSALVLLVDNHFNSYYGIQHDFAQLCNSLNEFHFDCFNKQKKHIQTKVLPEYSGRSHLETGDCYITKHSNLANVHVVFHLVTDDSLKNGDINSRHSMMASLRNILRVAHIHDIKTISIPLLLVDEMDEEILTVAWCLKRAELVLKCVKGFLIEMASLSTGVEQGTIQFLVPKGISENLFISLASLIPEVFRLANSVNLRTSTTVG